MFLDILSSQRIFGEKLLVMYRVRYKFLEIGIRIGWHAISPEIAQIT